MTEHKYNVGDKFTARQGKIQSLGFRSVEILGTAGTSISGNVLYNARRVTDKNDGYDGTIDEHTLDLYYVLQSRANTGEVTMVDPDTGGMKGQKPARFDLLPWAALEEIARHYGKGAEKYEDRNWEKGYDWSLSFAALQRHLAAWWGGEDIDAETGSSHLAAAAFHVLALLTFKDTHPEKDNRP